MKINKLSQSVFEMRVVSFWAWWGGEKKNNPCWQENKISVSVKGNFLLLIRFFQLVAIQQHHVISVTQYLKFMHFKS